MHEMHHLAQINIGRMRAPLTEPQMAGFVTMLNPINALADASPGFVWRLQTEDGDATALRPFGDDMLIVNMSVWASFEALHTYVYRSQHTEVMRDRKQWFDKFDGMYYALWWVPIGSVPTVAEAKARLDYLREHGESAHAFSFRSAFAPVLEPQLNADERR